MPNFEFHGLNQDEGQRDLKPYEIKPISGKFVANLPVAGTESAGGKLIVTAFGEQEFETADDAHRAVAAARKDLGLSAWN
jgi:hypothetical protein